VDQTGTESGDAALSCRRLYPVRMLYDFCAMITRMI